MVLIRSAFIALVCAASGVAYGQTPPEADYLRRRREAEKIYDTVSSQFTTAQRRTHDSTLADLEKRLRSIIGPIDVPGFPQPGKINLDGLCTREVDCAHLDGIVYRADWSKELLVTTPGLIAGWLKDRRAPSDTRGAIDAALRSSEMMGGAVAGNAAIVHYADLQIPAAARRGIVSAALIMRAQDYGPWPPNRVMVSVARGNRIFIIQVPPAVAIDPLAVCGAQLDSTFKAKRAAGLTPQQMSGEGPFVTYRACYGKHLSSIPGIDRIIAAATALVDALPP